MVENFSWVKVNFTNSFGLGVASNNANLIEEIKQTFKL